MSIREISKKKIAKSLLTQVRYFNEKLLCFEGFEELTIQTVRTLQITGNARNKSKDILKILNLYFKGKRTP